MCRTAATTTTAPSGEVVVLAEERQLAGGLAHSAQYGSNNSDRVVAAHGAAVDRVGCNQIYGRSVESFSPGP